MRLRAPRTLGEVARLRARVRLLEGALVSARTGPQRPTGKRREQGGGGEAAVPGTGRPARSRVSGDERVSHIAGVFESQSVDPAWAYATEEAIEAAVQLEQMRGSHLRAVDCRGTLCRAEVEHDSEQDFDIFTRELPVALPGLPRTTMKRLAPAGESMRTLVFLARAGYPMPGPARD